MSNSTPPRGGPPARDSVAALARALGTTAEPDADDAPKGRSGAMTKLSPRQRRAVFAKKGHSFPQK